MLVGSQARYGICPIKVMDTYTVFVLYMKTVTIDGGLLPFEAGSFNDLVEVPDNAWDEIEAMIKKVRGS
jgi:hypothetical protein